MFSLYFVILVIPHFGFEGGTLVLIASVTSHCLYFTFYGINEFCNRDFAFLREIIHDHIFFILCNIIDLNTII